jgi:hypothetical protein
MRVLSTFLSDGDRVESEVVAEHGIYAEGIVGEDAGQSPSEEEGWPLISFNGEEVAYESCEEEGGNPIKDAHVEDLWFS